MNKIHFLWTQMALNEQKCHVRVHARTADQDNGRHNLTHSAFANVSMWMIECCVCSIHRRCVSSSLNLNCAFFLFYGKFIPRFGWEWVHNNSNAFEDLWGSLILLEAMTEAVSEQIALVTMKGAFSYALLGAFRGTNTDMDIISYSS